MSSDPITTAPTRVMAEPTTCQASYGPLVAPVSRSVWYVESQPNQANHAMAAPRELANVPPRRRPFFASAMVCSSVLSVFDD